MYFSASNFRLTALTAIISLTLAQPVIAKDLSPSLTEEFIRETMAFEPDEALKFAECADKPHPRCTYVWGSPHKKDEVRINAGLAPEGKKLMIIFAQGASAKNFDQVTAVYSDAEPIENLGIAAVWSPRRHQISLMTETFLIMHVNIEDAGNDSLKTVAVDIANHILVAQ
ncbi:hypothetical protein AB9F26_06000 [Falsihalocynthiibacter sp. BN13B15]|uniref:hypothetical protein n=1 Tax=Falsihalocynthiibacter sp. BN13B15 TaxID=3240871 RepID=UPI00350EF4D0